MAKIKPKKETSIVPAYRGNLAVTDTDEYRSIVDDCQAIFDQTVFGAKMLLVEGMHSLGERIVKDPLFKKHSKGNQEFVQTLARDIHRNASEVYRAIAFCKRFPRLKEAASVVPGGKNITWTAVKKYLDRGDAEKCAHKLTERLVITLVKCRDCGKVIEKETSNHD